MADRNPTERERYLASAIVEDLMSARLINRAQGPAAHRAILEVLKGWCQQCGFFNGLHTPACSRRADHG